MQHPHSPQELQFLNFNQTEFPLQEIKKSQQGDYLLNYLIDLGSKKILLESNYFDRDYLSEFSVFYSTSVYGYKNICKRVHFFSNDNIDRELFKKATGGDKESVKILNDSYLGFFVLRPIQAQFGKTVLKWYENTEQNSQRIAVKRNYKCHIAGVTLEIKGLAWQQQDTGVGACATIALWSALQSSAFDDFHAIPTTTEITKAANKTTSFGSKTFPSKGLNYFQLYEAIKELGLSPMVQHGDFLSNKERYFTKERFMSSIASYIRSGYPVIILGNLKSRDQNLGYHAVCAVGFRDSFESPNYPITLEDSLSNVLYIHDDNIGSNARFKIKKEQNEHTILHLEAPKYSKFKKNDNYQIIPTTLVVATHNEIRTSPNQLYKEGLDMISNLYSSLKNKNPLFQQLSLGTRFIKLTNYINIELDRLLSANPKKLSELRLSLWEKERPMSLHLGLVRIGSVNPSFPLLDVLYDTTDSRLQRFTYIPFR